MAAPSASTNAFLYLPKDQHANIVYGPNFVCGDTTLTEYTHVSGAKAKAAIERIPPGSPLDFYDAVILTRRIGLGTYEDTHRPAVDDEYELGGYGIMAEIPSLSKQAEHLTHGYLVGIKANQDMLAMIQNDPKFHVVCTVSDKDEIPDHHWMFGLETWLLEHHVEPDAVNAIIRTLAGSTRLHIMKRLCNSFEELALQYVEIRKTTDSSSIA